MTTGADAAINVSAVAGGRFSTLTQLIKLNQSLIRAQRKINLVTELCTPEKTRQQNSI